MGRWALVIVAVLVAVFVAAAGVFVIRHDWAVEDFMERIHDGATSPWAVVKAQVGADTPDWDAVRKPATGFVEMGEVLTSAKSADIRASADGYVAAAPGIMDAVTRQDADAFRRSIGALEQSCHDCHFDGGVGGKLEGE